MQGDDAMWITSQLLRRAGAYCEDLEIFEREWREGVKVTQSVVVRALELGLDVDWAAAHLLQRPGPRLYREAREVAYRIYETRLAAAWREYELARKIALGAVRAGQGGDSEQHVTVINKLRAVLGAADLTALQEYRAARAEAFAGLFDEFGKECSAKVARGLVVTWPG